MDEDRQPKDGVGKEHNIDAVRWKEKEVCLTHLLVLLWMCP